MRGEVLEVESTEELVGKFGEEVVGEALGVRSFGKRESDEGGVKEVETGYGAEEEVQDVKVKAPKQKQEQKPEHLMTKAEKKKARRAAEKAEIARARELGEDVPSFGRKRKRGGNEQSEASEGDQSQAGDDDETEHHNADINDPSNYESSRSYALSQRPVLEDLPDRDPAGVDREEAVSAPVVVQHDAEGEVVVPPEGKKEKQKKKRKPSAYEEEEGKEARRVAKKAKREEGKREKDADVLMVDAGEAVAATTPAKSSEGGLSRKERKKLKEGGNGTPAAGANGEKKGAQTNGAPAAPAAASEKKAKKSKVKKEKGKSASS